MAAAILAKAGLARVANLAGGMVAWRGLGLPG
jgi:rhodanese-related sulfurtransferase